MPVDRRVRRGATDTITTFFYDGGETAVDKGAVTVSVASDSGAVLQTGSATNSPAGTYTFALSTAATAAVDRLTVTWTSVTETQTTFVEVAGGFYFDLAELRAMQDLTSTVTFPIERLRAARQWIETRIDETVGAPFVRRYFRDSFKYNDLSARMVVLNQPYARVLLGVSVSGVAQTAPQLALITIDHIGRLVTTGGLGWLDGYYAPVVDVRYEGAITDSCPGDLHDVALQAARFRLISTDGASGIPSRATSITNQMGNIQLSTAGRRRPTGIPDVDAVIMEYADTYRIPGIA